MWRQRVAQNWISNDKYTAFLPNSDTSGYIKAFCNYVKCCDRENVVGHHCTSVEKLWTKQKDYFGLEGKKKDIMNMYNVSYLFYTFVSSLTLYCFIACY